MTSITQDHVLLGGWVKRPKRLPAMINCHVMNTKTDKGETYIRHVVEECHCALGKKNGVVYWVLPEDTGYNLRRSQK